MCAWPAAIMRRLVVRPSEFRERGCNQLVRVEQTAAEARRCRRTLQSIAMQRRFGDAFQVRGAPGCPTGSVAQRVGQHAQVVIELRRAGIDARQAEDPDSAASPVPPIRSTHWPRTGTPVPPASRSGGGTGRARGRPPSRYSMPCMRWSSRPMRSSGFERMGAEAMRDERRVLAGHSAGRGSRKRSQAVWLSGSRQSPLGGEQRSGRIVELGASGQPGCPRAPGEPGRPRRVRSPPERLELTTAPQELFDQELHVNAESGRAHCARTRASGTPARQAR